MVWRVNDTEVLAAEWVSTSGGALGITAVNFRLFIYDGVTLKYLQADGTTFDAADHTFVGVLNGTQWEHSFTIPYTAANKILYWTATSDVSDLITLGNEHAVLYHQLDEFNHIGFTLNGVV